MGGETISSKLLLQNVIIIIYCYSNSVVVVKNTSIDLLGGTCGGMLQAIVGLY